MQCPRTGSSWDHSPDAVNHEASIGKNKSGPETPVIWKKDAEGESHGQQGTGRCPVSLPDPVTQYPEQERKTSAHAPPRLGPPRPQKDVDGLEAETQSPDQAKNLPGAEVAALEVRRALRAMPDKSHSRPGEVVRSEQTVRR
jgi:hypothetical protein